VSGWTAGTEQPCSAVYAPVVLTVVESPRWCALRLSGKSPFRALTAWHQLQIPNNHFWPDESMNGLIEDQGFNQLGELCRELVPDPGFSQLRTRDFGPTVS
jgi:hypothetical protein